MGSEKGQLERSEPQDRRVRIDVGAIYFEGIAKEMRMARGEK